MLPGQNLLLTANSCLVTALYVDSWSDACLCSRHFVVAMREADVWDVERRKEEVVVTVRDSTRQCETKRSWSSRARKARKV